MKQERVILSFIMVFIGLLVAGIVFYLYQSTKVIPANQTARVVNIPTPTPTPKPSIYLSISQPTDESVVSNSTLQIMGQTNPGATVIIITPSTQQVMQPSAQGAFSTTLTLEQGENLITIESVLANGDITSTQRTVTYSTESF